ncbi:hypothetical protein GGI43DRAFT_410666 [Trichoderma evansii]
MLPIIFQASTCVWCLPHFPWTASSNSKATWMNLPLSWVSLPLLETTTFTSPIIILDQSSSASPMRLFWAKTERSSCKNSVDGSRVSAPFRMSIIIQLKCIEDRVLTGPIT